VRACAPDDVRAVLGRLVVEDEQHTQLLLCNTHRAPRGKHAAARMCACAPGNEQAALGV